MLTYTYIHVAVDRKIKLDALDRSDLPLLSRPSSLHCPPQPSASACSKAAACSSCPATPTFPLAQKSTQLLVQHRHSAPIELALHLGERTLRKLRRCWASGCTLRRQTGPCASNEVMAGWRTHTAGITGPQRCHACSKLEEARQRTK